MSSLSSTTSKARQLLTFLLPSAAWAIQMQTCYTLIRYTRSVPALAYVHHAVSLLAILVCFASALLAYHDWKQAGQLWPKGKEPIPPERTAFLSLVGLTSAPLFALLIFMQWVPILFISPHDY